MLLFEGLVQAGDQVVLKYDPDQPRDGDGQWSETGAGGLGALHVGGRRVSQDALRRALEMGGGVSSEPAGYSDLTEQTGDQLVQTFKPVTPDLDTSEKRALKNYVSSSTDINKKLRTGEALTPSEKRTIAALDNSLAKSKLPKDVVLYRGIRYGGSRYDQVVADIKAKRLKPGALITDTGFTSTTLDKKIADTNFSQGGILFKINGKRGAKGLYVDAGLGGGSDYANEQEFLIPRNSRFKITGITKRGSGYVIEGEYQ